MNSRLLALCLLVATGCRNFDPFENDVPKVVSVNGVPYVNFGPVAFPSNNVTPDMLDRLIAIPGEDYAIDIVIDDPEGRDVRLWFPMAPPGLEFDPDETSGVWHVPDPPPPLPDGVIAGFVEDPLPRDPRQKEFAIPAFLPFGGDTGYEEP